MVQEYVRENYSLILEIAKTITHGRKPDYEDLAHEVILAVLESDREKMNDIIRKDAMRYWIVRLCLNNYRSKTSRYHYKYRKPDERHKQASEHLRFVATLNEIEDKKDVERLMIVVEEYAREMQYFEREAFRIYYAENHSLNSLARATGISRNTLYKAIRATRDHIQNSYEKRTRRPCSVGDEGDGY